MDKTWFTIIGYIVFAIYTCGIMLFGILLEKKTKLDKTFCRKLTHVIAGFIWVICYIFFGFSIHWVVLNIVGAILLGFVTLNKNFSAFQRSDAKNSPGMFYLALSTAIVAVICFIVGEELYLYTGIAYYALIFGDGFAPIVAKLFGKYNKEVRPSKSLVGTLTVFTATALSTFIFSMIFKMDLSLVFILSVAGLTAVTEFYGLKGLDNILIDLFVFAYLVLHHYGLVSIQLEIVLITSPFLAMLAVGSKAMAVDAGISAFFLFALVGFFGEGYIPILFIALLFLVSTFVSILSSKLKKESMREGSKPRRANQIIAVGLFAVIFLVLHNVTKIKVLYYIFFLALTEQIADSMASDIGRHTKKKNLSILTWRPVEKGISGGVSVLGTLSALVSSFAFMSLPYFLGIVNLKFFVIIAVLAFIGTIVDSVIGALFQSLYECDECNNMVETAVHCEKPTRLVKGFVLVDNVAVNYIAGFITCALGTLLFLI